MKSSIPFNPSDYDSYLTIKQLVAKFDYLHNMNFEELSLSEELSNLNYEIVSRDYQDKAHRDIKDYFHIEVDEIV